MKYRVSHVESFRQFERDEDMTYEDLVERIRGTASSPAMATGIAFHTGLELCPSGVTFESMLQGEYIFRFPNDMTLELPDVRELRASKTWDVEGWPITISGCVDAIDGLRIDDHKTTARFDPERYIDGCQWKLYCSIFGAMQFRWNVFEIKQTDEPGNVWEVCDMHTLTQYRYPGMEDDCTALVGRFADFVRHHL